MPSGHIVALLVAERDRLNRAIEALHIVSVRRLQENAAKLGELLKAKAPRGKTKREVDVNCLRIMVSRAGLEPATTALKVRCSTN
jgi:hypothetical protein